MSSQTSRETIQHARNTRPPSSTDARPRRSPDRDAYADAGMAVRYSRSLLEAADPSTFARRVWEAVAVDLLASWSRLSESRRHLTRDVCRLVGRDPESADNRREVGRALAVLRSDGVLGYRPASGSDPSVVTLPEPPDAWVDPTCGRTAGELREARRRAEELRQVEQGGVGEQYPKGGLGSTTPTRSEEVCEEKPNPPARESEPPTSTVEDPTTGGDEEEEQEDGQATDPVVEELLARLPHRLRPELDLDHRKLRRMLARAATSDVPPAALARHVLDLDAELGSLDGPADRGRLAGAIAYRLERTLDDLPVSARPSRRDRPPCQRCGGSSWLLDGYGDAHECPACSTEETTATDPTGAAS